MIHVHLLQPKHLGNTSGRHKCPYERRCLEAHLVKLVYLEVPQEVLAGLPRLLDTEGRERGVVPHRVLDVQVLCMVRTLAMPDLQDVVVRGISHGGVVVEFRLVVLAFHYSFNIILKIRE